MLPWLHSLLPHIPRDGFVPALIVLVFSNIGVPVAAKNDCF